MIFLLSSPKSSLQWVLNPWYTLHCISPQDSWSRWKLRFLLLLACSLSTHSCHIYPPAVIPPRLAISGMLHNLKGIHHVLIVLLNLAYPWPQNWFYKGIQIKKSGMLISSCQHMERRNLSWGITTSHCLWTYLWAIFLITEQCRKAQSTVSSAIHGRMVLGYTRELAEQHVSK